jgi:3-polyprenyl-4-hydroxybenzoate decarboxylase
VPYRDMRDYLATLEQHDLLKRITREVDRSWEIACLAKWMYQALPMERRFGLYFQNVKDSDIPVVLIGDVYVPLQIDPSVRDARGNVTQGSKIILDATQKIDAGAFSLPPRKLMMSALEVWKQCGLPELEIPKRARLRIDKS